MYGRTRRSAEPDVRDPGVSAARRAESPSDADLRLQRTNGNRAALSDEPSSVRPDAALSRTVVAHLQRTVGNTGVARALHGNDIVFGDSARSPRTSQGKRLLAPELTRASHVSVQRNGESQEVLTDLATPQVREGPAIEVQKALVNGLESRLEAIIESDAEKQSEYEETTMVAHQKKVKEWEDWGGFGWSLFRGKLPDAPQAPFGSGKRAQVTEKNALEFNLGGILIDSLPEYTKKDYAGFYKGLADKARLVRLDTNIRGARSSGTVVPELVGDLAPLVIENTLKTMIDASQFKYLRAAGLPNAQWKILVEVHYIRARPKDMAGFHKDTQGQTLFVNLNYHAGEHSLRGPEYVLNPPRSAKHDERIFGKGETPGTLPKQFTDDLTHAREQLGDPTEIRSSGTVQPYGYVAFVDEAIHHATPFFENRYVTPEEFSEYLQRTDKRKLDEIIRAKDKGVDADTSIIGADEIDKWTAWWNMITNPANGARYTRLHFAATMEGDEFDRMLENVGAQPNAERQHGRAGGWYAASIPNDGKEPLRKHDKPPLIRQASNRDLSRTWPDQLPEDVPRRFLRTWVRAVPAAMAEQLKNQR